MSTTDLLWYVFIGLTAGFLAGQLVRGRGLGLTGSLVIGIVGALLGGYIYYALMIPAGGGTLGAVLIATLSAALLLFLAGMLRRA